MALSATQQGVLKGMALGMICAIAILIWGMVYSPRHSELDFSLGQRLLLAINSLLAPVFFLLIAVARLAKHRFFTPEDIDGGLSQDSPRAQLLQSLLQNTLEQLAIATVIYIAWAMLMPAAWLVVVPLSATAFGLGRILFFAGFSRGAAARSLGFALTFYPSLLMLLVMVFHLLWQGLTA